MKTNQHMSVATVAKSLGLLLLLSCHSAVLAQDAVNHAAHAAAETVKDAQQKTTELTKATVRKIDLAQGKITLKHEAIKNIGMPAMTMVFKVAEPAMLNGLNVNDAVQFSVEKQGAALIVTEITQQNPGNVH